MPHAYLDIQISTRPIGRIVVELFDELAPLASKNFLALVQGPLQDTTFHRVIKNFVIQSGDIEFGKNGAVNEEKLGKGNEAVLGGVFAGENLEAEIVPFSLCMANAGDVNANGSQFFIATHPQPHLRGKHTVFGRVIAGKSVVREVERVETTKQNVPVEPVVIVASGIWSEGMPTPVYNASYDTRGGDIYEEYPDDDVYIDKESSESVYRAAEKIKESGTLLFKAGQKQEALFKYAKCLRYIMEYIPDQDQEPQWYASYVDIKKKLYLNMSLVNLQLKQYQRAVDFSSYLLDLDDVSKTERAKGYFRMGSAFIELRKYKEASAALKSATELVPEDVAITRELTRCEQLLEQQKKDERKKYSKFFG